MPFLIWYLTFMRRGFLLGKREDKAICYKFKHLKEKLLMKSNCIFSKADYMYKMSVSIGQAEEGKVVVKSLEELEA